MKKKLKVVIVDDEPLAREKLRDLLFEFTNVNLLGEAEDVKSATELINSVNPDCILLDIQLAGESGFDVLKEISNKINVIFVTAYDKYAIRAFEVNAFDYLMKPVKKSRLREAIERLISVIPTRVEEKPKFQYEDHVFLSLESGSQFLKIKDIISINACAPYSEIITTEGKRCMVLKPLKEWESRLPKEHFVRIHRSTIININFVKQVEKWFNYAFRVHLKDIPNPLIISRRYANELKRRF